MDSIIMDRKQSYLSCLENSVRNTAKCFCFAFIIRAIYREDNSRLRRLLLSKFAIYIYFIAICGTIIKRL